jgi:U1 small nuclear ribonucleoprotein A
MSNQNDNRNSEQTNPENKDQQENSLFSTIMRGTPNLLDLIDPGKVSDSAFSTHKTAKVSKEEPVQESVKSTPIVEEDTKLENQVLELPDLPLPGELPEPIIETEALQIEQESIFKVNSEEISTLYIKNLNEKINLTDMKYSLNFLFSQFGEVIAIQISKKNKLRGQCFITFAKPGQARRALKSLQGLSFFRKELQIQIAKTKSLASFIYEGKFHNLSERIHALRKSKVGIKTMLKDTEPAEAKHLMKTASQVISVHNFPENLTVDRFKLLFRQFPGFKSARLIPQRKVGLVEFYDKAQAMMALRKYEGFMMDEQHLLKVRFAQQDESNN